MMDKQLGHHILRSLLLEDQDYKDTIMIRAKFNRGDLTREQALRELRARVTEKVKRLMTDEELGRLL